MQAVRVRRTSAQLLRHATHLLLVGAVGVVAWISIPAQPGAMRPLASVPVPDRRPPASPALDWSPIRTPVWTTHSPETSPVEVAQQPVEESERAVSAPQAAIVPTIQVPAQPPTLGMLVSMREVNLWGGADPNAQRLTHVPPLTLLEPLGLVQNGRIPVQLGLSDQGTAWIEAAAVAPIADRSLPRPWDRPFAFGETSFRLSIPYRTQLDGSAAALANCGPASLGMILDSFGLSAPTAELRDRANRFQGTSGPYTGFDLGPLKQVAESYGLQGEWLFEDDRYRKWTLDDVRHQLQAGHPVIPQLKYRLIPGREGAPTDSDHYLVLSGMDGDDFLANDPIPWSRAGQVRFTASQLLRAWMNSDHPGAALAIAAPLNR